MVSRDNLSCYSVVSKVLDPPSQPLHKRLYNAISWRLEKTHPVRYFNISKLNCLLHVPTVYVYLLNPSFVAHPASFR